jgi:hypothetical protein
MRDFEQGEESLCCCLSILGLDCDKVPFSPGAWENGGTRTGEEDKSTMW